MSFDLKVSNGLGFHAVAQQGVGHMPAKGEGELEAVLAFYVVATRATQRLQIRVGGDSALGHG